MACRRVVGLSCGTLFEYRSVDGRDGPKELPRPSTVNIVKYKKHPLSSGVQREAISIAWGQVQGSNKVIPLSHIRTMLRCSRKPQIKASLIVMTN